MEEREAHRGQLVHVGGLRNHHLLEDAALGTVLVLDRLRVVAAEHAAVDRHGRRCERGEVAVAAQLEAHRDRVADPRRWSVFADTSNSKLPTAPLKSAGRPCSG
jgi:hypothetical protein